MLVYLAPYLELSNVSPSHVKGNFSILEMFGGKYLRGENKSNLKMTGVANASILNLFSFVDNLFSQLCLFLSKPNPTIYLPAPTFICTAIDSSYTIDYWIKSKTVITGVGHVITYKISRMNNFFWRKWVKMAVSLLVSHQVIYEENSH